jgi:hypothetical protein
LPDRIANPVRPLIGGCDLIIFAKEEKQQGKYVLTGAVPIFAGAMEGFPVERYHDRVGELTCGFTNAPKGIAIGSYAFPLSPVEECPCPVQDEGIRCVRLQGGVGPAHIVTD